MLPLSLSLPSPAAADTPGPAHGPAQQSFTPALLLSVLQPDLAPPGTNNFRCRPTARHPRPIVLVHGTGANA
ncbi:MAG: lipase, partial [Nocardioidaceae bacterium]